MKDVAVYADLIDPLRLHALRALAPVDQLDLHTPTRIVRLVSRFVNAPVALATLVEPSGQMFLASLGLPEPWARSGGTPLTHSFCQHVVCRQQPLIISDARVHPLVADNLAIRDLNVIAYAGVPLRVAPNVILGALCAIDTVPRTWTAEEVAVLEDLAEALAAELVRVQLERQQAQTQGQLAALVDHAQDGIWSVDRAGVLLACNAVFLERMRSVYGMTLHVGDTLLEHLPPDVQAFWHPYYNRALAGEHVVVERMYGLGELNRWYEHMLSPIRVAGAVVGVTVVSRDCTARKHAEIALREQTELYESLLHAQSDLGEVVLISEGDRLLFVNDAYTQLTGYTQEEALGFDSFADHLTPEARHIFKQREAQLSRGEPLAPHYETALIHKDGRQIDIEAAVTTVTIHDRLRKVVIARDITARKRAEQELRLRDRALAASRNGILITDPYQPDHPIIYCNPAFSELTGYEVNEVLGRNCRFLQGADTDPAAVAEIREALRAEQPCRVTLRNYRKDGTPFWNDLTLAPVRDEAGRLSHFVGVQADVTARVEVEVALRQSEARFALAFHANPASMAITTVAEGRYVDVNLGFARLLGLDRTEIVGRTAHNLEVWADDHDRAQLIERLRADGRVRDLDVRFRSATGEERLARVAVEPIEVGGVPCLLSLIDDITERRAAEQGLRESERRFRHLAQNSPDCIYLVDVPSQQLLYGNRPMFLGYTLDQLRDPSAIFQYVHSEDQAMVLAHWQEVLSTPTDAVPPINYRFRAADGSWEWLQQRATVVARSEEDLPAQLLVTIGVTTAQKHAEDERRALERKLQETQKLESLGVLAGGIAHDFNNLLAAVLGNAEIALMDLGTEHPAYPSVAHIQLAGRRAADLTAQMLAYAGKGRFQVEPLDLNELVREITLLLRTSIPKLVALTTDLAPVLPYVAGDVTQIRQVLMNLVINGAEAMEGRAGLVTVRTELCSVRAGELEGWPLGSGIAPGSYVALTVTDTGCGIDAATQARIFDPFFTTKFTGRGLGLAAVLGIVRAHAGAIQIESAIGQGTSITVLLPQEETEQRQSVVQTSRQRSVAPQQARHQTVLVIDDEADVRAVTERMLTRLGYDVLLAPDGEAGAELFARHVGEVHAVLLDLTMPKLSAEQTVARLQTSSNVVPIVVISGYSAQDVRDRFAPGVIAGVVQKPFTPQQLLQVLEASAATVPARWLLETNDTWAMDMPPSE